VQGDHEFTLFQRPELCSCDENPTGAVTRNIFVNDLRVVQNTTTPGNGDEPGFAFTVAPNGIVTQWAGSL
jgi:hypothetical protein